jgi:DtxR family Mn-dependent transcriptional regulator
MEASSQEDVLEALCVLAENGNARPTMAEIAVHLSREESAVRAPLNTLARSGEVVIEGGSVVLTPRGEEIGCRIMRKHRILQSFFAEMLGMKPEEASREACVLEHGISDEAADRLNTYLGRAAGLPCVPACPLPAGTPVLSDFPEGTLLKVTRVCCRDGCQRLSDLGILPGVEVALVRRIPGRGVVIRVKGCDIALSQEIARFIAVEHV